MKNFLKNFAPRFVWDWYHRLWALAGALLYGFPSRKIFVLGVTGTKGKTSVTEIISALLEEAGFKTALSNSLRFKIGGESERNFYKMTMPGRFFLQKFLKRAVKAGCRYALIEVTSEGILQFRHRFIDWDAALFTNLAPEHIEAHGSFENYRQAKLKFFNYFSKSRKKKKIIVVNGDDENAEYFLKAEADEKWIYGTNPQFPRPTSPGRSPGGRAISNPPAGGQFSNKLLITNYQLLDSGVDFEIKGQNFRANLVGQFNLYNVLAAMAFARSQGIDWEIIKIALEKFKGIPGRMEFVQKEPFAVVVDYAHTPDSLEQVYKTMRNWKLEIRNWKLVCILGACGGGRDKWKRPEMGRIAGEYCDEIILTNEDPYDENPNEIINQVEKGVLEFIQNQDRFSRKDIKIKKILNRREAIRGALKSAKPGDAVIITGKGAEPWIMGPKGSKIPWDDREVAREELKKIKNEKP